MLKWENENTHEDQNKKLLLVNNKLADRNLEKGETIKELTTKVEELMGEITLFSEEIDAKKLEINKLNKSHTKLLAELLTECEKDLKVKDDLIERNKEANDRLNNKLDEQKTEDSIINNILSLGDKNIVQRFLVNTQIKVMNLPEQTNRRENDETHEDVDSPNLNEISHRQPQPLPSVVLAQAQAPLIPQSLMPPFGMQQKSTLPMFKPMDLIQKETEKINPSTNEGRADNEARED